jgi:hypothetical protein
LATLPESPLKTSRDPPIATVIWHVGGPWAKAQRSIWLAVHFLA